MAVQRGATLTVFIQQNRVAPIPQPIYSHTHNGWMALVGIEFSLPHNPLVPGSIPGCPIFIINDLHHFTAHILTIKTHFFRI